MKNRLSFSRIKYPVIIIQPMRRLIISVLLLIFFSLACRTVLEGLPTQPTLATSTEEIQTDAALTAPTSTPTARPSATIQPTPTQPPPLTKTPVEKGLFEVRFHPDGPLFVGDLVSLEIIPQGGRDTPLTVEKLADQQVEGRLPGATEPLGSAPFQNFGIGGRNQATLTWIWDTSGLAPGTYKLEFDLVPDGYSWTEQVVLLPADQAPPPEPEAHWEMVETGCCFIHFITGTDAARDLKELIATAEAQALDSSQRLDTQYSEKMHLTFLPRVLGHGGFASEEIFISYLDRDYAGGSLDNVVHHEMIHILDRQIGGKFRPSLLVEGLAVYLTGGHFKPEPLMERASALMPAQENCVPLEAALKEKANPDPVCSLGGFIPLKELFDNFYFSQHEIGYLEAGALVEFMVKEWGWETFNQFYRNIEPLQNADGKPKEANVSEIVDAGLQKSLGLSLVSLEAQFVEALKKQTLSPVWVEDVRLTVDYYDTVRRYQELLDPSAYFLYAWLPDNQAMREKGIVADYLRRPSAPENLALEELLVQANTLLLSGKYPELQVLLDQINQNLSEAELD